MKPTAENSTYNFNGENTAAAEPNAVRQHVLPEAL